MSLRGARRRRSNLGHYTAAQDCFASLAMTIYAVIARSAGNEAILLHSGERIASPSARNDNLTHYTAGRKDCFASLAMTIYAVIARSPQATKQSWTHYTAGRKDCFASLAMTIYAVIARSPQATKQSWTHYTAGRKDCFASLAMTIYAVIARSPQATKQSFGIAPEIVRLPRHCVPRNDRLFLYYLNKAPLPHLDDAAAGAPC